MKKMFRNLCGMFRRAQPVRKTLHNIDPEELRRERIRIEQTETRLTREIEELEQQKADHFKKGVVEISSDRQQRQIARKIKEIDSVIQTRDKQLALISRNLRVLNGLAQLKENERLLKDLGMEGLINQMDLEELQAYVEKATIEGQFQMEKFTTLIDSLEDAEDVYSVAGEDSDTLAIVEAMQKARQAGTDSSITEGIRQMDEVLHHQPVTVAN